MLSGTQLVLLTMFSTVNVVGPAGGRLDPGSMPMLIGLLIVAAIMTCMQIHVVSMPKRRVFKSTRAARLSRRHAGPAPRRV